MVNVQQLLKEKQKHQDAAAKIDEQISQAALESFKPQLEDVVSMVDSIETFDKEVKAHVRTLVNAVFGSEYGIRKKGSAAGGAGERDSQGFEWEALTKTLKKAGITSKQKAIGRSELAKLHFENDTSDFKASIWNDKASRDRHLESHGTLRSTVYWVKK